MAKEDAYKKLIFPDDLAKNQLLETVRQTYPLVTDFDEAWEKLFFKADETFLQKTLAPFLRALAIKQLREGHQPIVTEIRKNYSTIYGVGGPSLITFLNQQQRPFVFATDLEAIALAEALGVDFAVTQVDGAYKVTGPCRKYYHSQTLNADVVHLYNLVNNHFFINEGDYHSTIGDGNCLYNGFAQTLRQILLFEKKLTQDNGLSAEDKMVYELQCRLYETIKKLPALPLETVIQQVKQQPFTPNEQKDHEVAKATAELELALKLSSQINAIHMGAEALHNKNETAASIATTLAGGLEDAFKEYQQTKDTKKFQDTCVTQINFAKPFLQPFSGWDTLLKNVLAIVLLGLPLLYNRYKNGHWFFYQQSTLSSPNQSSHNEMIGPLSGRPLI